MVGTTEGKTDAVVMVRLSEPLIRGYSTAQCLEQVNFAPDFVADPNEATVEVVADHVEHIAKIAGKKQYAFAFRRRHSYTQSI